MHLKACEGEFPIQKNTKRVYYPLKTNSMTNPNNHSKDPFLHRHFWKEMADRLTKAALSAAQRGGLRGLFLFFGPEVQYKYVH